MKETNETAGKGMERFVCPKDRGMASNQNGSKTELEQNFNVHRV